MCFPYPTIPPSSLPPSTTYSHTHHLTTRHESEEIQDAGACVFVWLCVCWEGGGACVCVWGEVEVEVVVVVVTCAENTCHVESLADAPHELNDDAGVLS